MITLEEATDATDQAITECITEVENRTDIDRREKDKLIDMMLEIRQESIDTLIALTPEEEQDLRIRWRARKALALREK